jgi:5-methylcytosine-specific restriction endonuclease McrA
MTSRRVIINGRDQIDPRHTRAWRKLRDRVAVEEPTCRLGFPGICTRDSTTADHIIPVSQRPDLAMMRENLRGACRPCNDARGKVPNESLNLNAQPRAWVL